MIIKVGDYVKYKGKVYSVATESSLVRLISYKDLEILENIPKSELKRLTDFEVECLRETGGLPKRRFNEGDMVKIRADLDSKCVYSCTFKDMGFREGESYIVRSPNNCSLGIKYYTIHEFEVDLVEEEVYIEDLVFMFKIGDLVKVKKGNGIPTLKNHSTYVVEEVTKNHIYLINDNGNKYAYSNSNFILDKVSQLSPTKKMVCIDNKSNKNPKNDPKYNYRLTIGKSYNVIKHKDNLVTVLNDEGIIRYYPDRSFKEEEQKVKGPIFNNSDIRKMNDVLVAEGFRLEERWLHPIRDSIWDIAWIKGNQAIYTDICNNTVHHRSIVTDTCLELESKEFSKVIEYFTHKPTLSTSLESSKSLDRKLINLKKEKEMTKSSTVISLNKQAVVSASKIYTGKLCNKKLKSLVSSKLPVWIQGYADTPWFDLVLANLVSISVNNTKLKDNTKATFVVDGMLQSASLDILESFDIDSILDNLLSGIKLPSGL